MSNSKSIFNSHRAHYWTSSLTFDILTIELKNYTLQKLWLEIKHFFLHHVSKRHLKANVTHDV